MKKVFPLLILSLSLAGLSACTRLPAGSLDSAPVVSPPVTAEAETITSSPAASQTDDDLLRELTDQSDLSLDSDLSQLESELITD